MPTYVAFLRAINVGGRFVKMATLAGHFRQLGHSEVRTCVNSGSVIFRSGSRRPEALADALERELEPLLGFRTEAFVRRADEVRAATARAFALAAAAPAYPEINVAWLRAPLRPPQAAALQALATDVDRFEHHGREVFWLCRVKQSESTFSNAVFERRVGVRTTLRRASMLQGLCELLPAACR